MAIGFIPFAGDEDEAAEDDGHAPEETWAGDEVLRLHGDLFEQVRRYAAQWERIDPGNHNAAQELSKVMVVLGHAQTWQERLEVLRSEAQRLMVGVAQAKTEMAHAKTERWFRCALSSIFVLTWIWIGVVFSP
jgi:hypothetical protein